MKQEASNVSKMNIAFQLGIDTSPENVPKVLLRGPKQQTKGAVQ